MLTRAQVWVDGDQLITIADAAQLLSMPIKTVSAKVDRGQLSAYRDPTARNPRRAARLVRKSEVLALGRK